MTEVFALLRDHPHPHRPSKEAGRPEVDGGGRWRRAGGQEGRAGRQSRVGLTPVRTGWEAVLGAMPGKECRGWKSSQLLELLCFVPTPPAAMSARW